MTYGGERADAQVLDQLETILRHVADELAGWHARALKAEAELKELVGKSGSSPKPDLETRSRVADLEQENRALRQRVEAASVRVHDLLSRLTFLEEQARESGNGGSGGGGVGGGRSPGSGDVDPVTGPGGATGAGGSA